MSHQPIRRDYELVRGETFRLSVPVAEPIVFDDARDFLTAGAILRLTIKRFDDDPDPGLAQVDSDTTGGLTIDDETHFTAMVEPVVTAEMPLGRAHYDACIDFSSTESWPLFYGFINVVPFPSDP